MISLLNKEINLFLSSTTAYLVIGVFLLATSLFVWLMPNNILEFGYANIDPLFAVAPWVFMFLIPAMTMRTFAEEQKTGTAELLFTKPFTDFQIVWAKFLANVLLVALALLPTLLYVATIYYLADPVGNIDTGSIVGSYIGLMLLASSFVAMGLLASATTDNQIVAFVVAIALCFVFYLAFESIAQLLDFSGIANQIVSYLSINTHYLSLSKGVIDSRDVVYFTTLVGIFLYSTTTILGTRKW